MKILVFNGSPKGLTSITMQSVKFIQKKFPQHDLKIINISQKINKIQKDNSKFKEIIEQVKLSDGILWATPVYYFLVPSQYKAFIEMVMQKDTNNVFKDKYAAALTTSVHLMDHIAHNYLNSICDDLSMKYLGSFSADMHDLLDEKERDRLFLFAQNFFNGINEKKLTAKNFGPVFCNTIQYNPSSITKKYDVGDKRFVIVTDADDNHSNLAKMTETISNALSGNIEVINLHDIDIKTGCHGCYHCGYDNKCRFENEDGFVDFFNKKIQPADILLFCGTITDRYLSSRWKLFFDRTFFKQHIPYFRDKQLGFILSGPLKQNQNLRQAMEAYADLLGANLVDIVTDENGNSTEIDALLKNLAKQLIRFSQNNYSQPRYFYAIGGMKIFRDLFWGKYRFLCQADHKFYKDNGIYDFPQKNYQDRLINSIVVPLTKIPTIRKKLYDNVRDEMVKPFTKVLNRIK